MLPLQAQAEFFQALRKQSRYVLRIAKYDTKFPVAVGT